MQGLIVSEEEVERAQARLADLPSYESQDFVAEVGTPTPYEWEGAPVATGPSGERTEGAHHIVVLDEGLKYNILRHLRRRGCRVTCLPPQTAAAEVLALAPDGVLLSPGPGDPALREVQVQGVGQLLGRVPLMGICLGHQVIGRALGRARSSSSSGTGAGTTP